MKLLQPKVTLHFLAAHVHTSPHLQDDPRWYIADPICTFLFAIIVLFTTVSIVKDILHTLMERAPQSVDMVKLQEAIRPVLSLIPI